MGMYRPVRRLKPIAQDGIHACFAEIPLGHG